MSAEPPKSPSRWKSRLLLGVLGSAVALGAVELGLRLFWHNPYAGESETVLILKRNPPGIERDYDRRAIDPESASVRFRTDARSYVRPSFQYERPDASVVFLGGSTTACVAVAEELRFPALVSTLLAEQGLRVNTLNAARSGNNVHDSLNVFLNHVVEDRPEVAVLMHAVNDHGTLTRRGSYVHSMGAPLSSFHLRYLLKMEAASRLWSVGFVRERLARVEHRPGDLARPVAGRIRPEHARSLPIDLYRERLHAFVALARAFRVQPVLMTQPLSGLVTELTPSWSDLGAQERFNTVIREVARGDGIPLVDLARRVASEVPDWQEPLVVFYDGMHVSDAGSRIYARFISETLAPLLRDPVRR